ncbi:putative Membrane-fusion protein [Candidatus Terasakiella magnetica]|uniref:Membrane fusion protein (MFP) family protein n=1 Tax=Candidatus Terasakiella magnetica TaxID=1867952 RepID=A0A1C3RDJ8_9PROT|nr:HlyD family type I secretion periplasmic adaptor subunit [Candidatus Terasakiella magnetica]SCA55356.1 putative Membrane-fusion protein [Candidatus Terasakiella magnetica]
MSKKSSNVVHEVLSKKRNMPREQLKLLSHEAMLEEAGPSRAASGLIILITALLASSVIWAHFVEIKTSATTQGTVIPSGDKRVVQHLEGGIVKSILVRDGDIVKKGQTLMQFEPTLRTAELNQIRAREAALAIKLQRLRAFIDGTVPDYTEFAKEYPQLVEESMFNLNGVRARIEGEKTVLSSQIDQQRKSVENYKKQMVSLKKQSKLLKQAVTMRKKLFKSGHGSRVNLINAELDLAKNRGSITEADVSREQAIASIEETKNQILELEVQERGKALDELDNVSGQLAEVRENIARLEDKVTRLEIISPVGGLVHGLEINTPGAVVEPAQVVMEIIPADEQVIIENKILPSDIGHIAEGQETTVTVTGFDARRYGTMKGELIKFSPTTFMDEEGVPYFRGHIRLKEEHLLANGVQHEIVPGMTVQANIITGEQTLLEYLTRPVYVSLLNAFRER